MRSKFSVIVILLLASVEAFATTDSEKTVDRLGIQYVSGGSGAYFSVVEGWSLACGGGYMYLDLTTPFGQAAYATLLTARTTGKLLSRIDYTLSSGICNATIIEIEN